MKIDCVILGAYETNCYVLRSNQEAQDCLIIDAGLEAEELIDLLKKNQLNPVAVVLTHGHIDHIGGVAILRECYPDIKVYIHKLDAEMLTEAHSNLSILAGEQFSTEPAEVIIEDESVIDEAGIQLQVLHTPGHTPGGICLYSQDEGAVFTDDTLFAESIGRTDFPKGSMSELLKSIKDKLLSLPDDTVVFPGHGPVTTLGREKAHNQYLQ